MKALRIISATLAAGLCALGLSVGASLAEGQTHPAKPLKAGEKAPQGLCLLHDL